MDNDSLSDAEKRAADAAAMIATIAQALPPEELPRFAAKLNHFCEQDGVRIKVWFGEDDPDKAGPSTH